ncbi:MAG TPA: mannitol dehydrogenase family protein [Plantibacter sp.]|uniref:mannitol dehydrogenase family protein n=1 Tax=unclassified Plantibacter TaxID=2624265 RepID=UPI002BA7F68C|nr:mannitol dehydrogenase family protein [Plantibacter sp.]
MTLTTTATTAPGAAQRLSRSTCELPAAPIRIVHFGLGAFHRAHQAWYTDVVDTDRAWGIAAITGRSPQAAEELAPQDGLFTVVERSAEADEARIVASITEAVDGADLGRLVELIAAPDTAIVTLTITEAGYRLDTDGAPLADDPAVIADLAALAGNGVPATALGRLLRGLLARRTSGSGPIAIVPCDNIPDNGPFVATGLRALAVQVDPTLATWIDDNVSFVSTSIDRITPRTTAADLDVASALIGLRDEAAVVTEPFHDWVLSGDFPAGRPAWEQAGARFVDDIEPFERRKLWLLNGAHTLLASAGRLRGHETVAAAVADPVCRAWVEEFWDEAVRHLPDGLDLDAYRAALLERFDNARIEHRLSQIGQDSVTKLRVRAVPIVLAERAAGRSGAAAIRVITAWVALVRSGTVPADASGEQIAAALAVPDEQILAGLLATIDTRLTDDLSLLAEIDAAAASIR